MSATAWTAVLTVLLVLFALAWYLSYAAARLDRLHHRVEGSRGALDNQLLRRATAAGELAGSGLLDPATSVLLAGAAAEAVAAGEPSEVADRPAGLFATEDAGAAAREKAESDLSRTLRAVLGNPEQAELLRENPIGSDLLRQLDAAGHRVVLARRFHNDAVTQARRVRAKRLVRWTRLQGRAPLPQTVEIDDVVDLDSR